MYLVTKVIPELESPIELRVVGEVVVVVLWSPIELRVLGEVVVVELCEPEQLECCEQPNHTILVVVPN